MTAVATAPAPITTMGDRRVTTVHTLRIIDGTATQVRVHTHHDKERKTITSYANRYTEAPSGTQGFTVSRSDPMAAILIARTPVQRYSGTQMLELHDNALDVLETIRNNHEGQTLFA